MIFIEKKPPPCCKIDIFYLKKWENSTYNLKCKSEEISQKENKQESRKERNKKELIFGVNSSNPMTD